MPRVTIITALYNHESYIASAIRSVLEQTYDDWEYIIWDDGSQDGSFKIAKEFSNKDSRIKVFSHPDQKNLGQENTRNEALKYAQGELLCLLDSDDLFAPQKLEKLVHCFKNEKVGLAYGKMGMIIEQSGERFTSKPRVEPEGKIFDQLVKENFIGAGAVLFRKTCLPRENPFDARFRTCGEYPLWLRIAKDWEIAHVPEVVYWWRNDGNNLSSKLALEARKELVELTENLLKDSAYQAHHQSIKLALAKKRYDYAVELYNRLDLKKVRRVCMSILQQRARTEIRAKATLLLASTFLGRQANQKLSQLKRKRWESKHPFAQAQSKRAQS